DIGGLKQDLGWDTADNIVAMEKGWKTKVFRDVTYQQLRPIGRFSKRDGFVRQGLGAYKLRYSKFYMTIKVLHDMVKRPYFINGIYYLKGYFRASGKYPQRTLTRSQGKILRKLLWQSMFKRLKNRDFMIFQLIGKKN
ncbi:MAG: hypothetical protein IH594_02760, partial [Bacteroidales bacterium]|nr:hypothetical protein [Bacteroidales bacterium]